MEKLITGIHHVCLKPWSNEKFQETIHFYRDILGMEVVRQWGDGAGCMLWAGNALMEIFNNGEGEKPTGSVNHFALATHDVAACVEAVRSAGYPITAEMKEVTIPAEKPFPLRCAFCVGPVGEEIEFFTEL